MWQEVRWGKQTDLVGEDKDNENQIFIKDNWICSMYEVVVEGPECQDC